MREGFNEYGTPVGIFICRTCGHEFTVCPKPKNPAAFHNCLAPECPSYDPNRDADVLFLSDEELAKRPVVGMAMLRARKAGLLRVEGSGPPDPE